MPDSAYKYMLTQSIKSKMINGIQAQEGYIYNMDVPNMNTLFRLNR